MFTILLNRRAKYVENRAGYSGVEGTIVAVSGDADDMLIAFAPDYTHHLSMTCVRPASLELLPIDNTPRVV